MTWVSRLLEDSPLPSGTQVQSSLEAVYTGSSITTASHSCHGHTAGFEETGVSYEACSASDDLVQGSSVP